MAIIQLPVLDELRSYPTLGPTVTALTDINGLAASLELYFGHDVLTRADGSLTPVQWRGYDKTVGRYQGEITDKPILRERFVEKVEEARAHAKAIASMDWAPMRKVLDTIRDAVSALSPLEDVKGDDRPGRGDS